MDPVEALIIYTNVFPPNFAGPSEQARSEEKKKKKV